MPNPFRGGCIAAELYDSTVITSAIPVRLATAADVDDLAALLHDFNTEFETPTPGAEVLAPRLRSLLGGSSTFAMLCGASPIGFGLVTLRWNVWFVGLVGIIDELYVEPSSRGRGVGTALMAGIELECRARSVEYVEINVDAGDDGPRRFYERLGYAGVEDTGEPALYYSRELRQLTSSRYVAPFREGSAIGAGPGTLRPQPRLRDCLDPDVQRGSGRTTGSTCISDMLHHDLEFVCSKLRELDGDVCAEVGAPFDTRDAGDCVKVAVSEVERHDQSVPDRKADRFVECQQQTAEGDVDGLRARQLLFSGGGDPGGHRNGVPGMPSSLVHPPGLPAQRGFDTHSEPNHPFDSRDFSRRSDRASSAP